MKLPPADLLEELSGVEQGLRENRKGGRIAGLGLAISLVEIAVAANSERWDLGDPVILIGLAVAVGSAALLARSRVWIRESSTPFGYTCSIVPFDLDASSDEEKCCEIPTWLQYDLAEKLNDRIGRLAFLEIRQPAREPPGEGTDEHIHITGQIVVRMRKDKKLWIEVAPRVRVGKNGKPATLAHSVSQVWERTSKADSVQISPTHRVDWKDYEKILERVYFNLASHIYKQIESDIRHKIHLLPGKYLRATAFLNEADDYGNSNTLVGLDYAIRFYREAMALYDPCWRDDPKGTIRLWAAWLLRAQSVVVRRLRQRVAVVVPRVARKEIRTARAEVGLANALLHRRTLAGMSGRRLNTVYEAPKLAESAIRRLERLPEDAPDRKQALFNAYVSRALAYVQLESPARAVKDLEMARRVIPSGHDHDPSYLYAQGLLEDLPASAIRFLRLAVERQQRFEVARFELALKSEMVWRTRPVLEEKVARVILEEYDEVLKLNPGNIGASSHAAYIHWLLGHPEDASGYFHQGSEFKLVKADTAIGELDYGMARVAVEEGAALVARSGDEPPERQRNGATESEESIPASGHDVRAATAQLLQGVSSLKSTLARLTGDEPPAPPPDLFPERDELLFRAYRHYVRGATAQLLLGVSDWKSTSAQFYFFDAMSDAMMERYDKYYANAKKFLETGVDKEQRVRETVMSFVENDYGEACYAYYLRNYDPDRLKKAKEAFKGAKDKNKDAILPYYNCYLLLMHEGDWEGAIQELKQLRGLEPSWSDALLASIASHADAASRWISRRRGPNNEALDEARMRERLQQMLKAIFEPAKVKDTAHPAQGREKLVAAVLSGGVLGSGRRKAAGTRSEVGAKEEPEPDVLARDLAVDLKRLVPHTWLWSPSRNSDPIFRWNVFSERSARSRRWEQELDELQVQAVFKWAVARLIYDQVTTAEVKRGDLLVRSDSVAESVLSCLESRFWPGNFALLFTLLQLENEKEHENETKHASATAVRKRSERPGAEPEHGDERNGDSPGGSERRENLKKNLEMLVERWLKDSPTSFWALELVVMDFFDFRGRPLQLFSERYREGVLKRADDALQSNGRTGTPNPHLVEWVDVQLKRLNSEQKTANQDRVPAGVNS